MKLLQKKLKFFMKKFYQNKNFLKLQEIKNKIYFQNIKKFHYYYSLLLITLSFALQPTNLRFNGYSVTLFLFLITSLIGQFYIKKIFLIKKNFIIYPILIYLIINFIFIQDIRILAILLCLGFYLYSSSQSLNYFQIQNLIKVLYVVLIFILSFAWYNFFNGFILKNQNFHYLSHFPFLSITYTVGSRGYDSFYFILGSILSYFFFLRSQQILKFINFCIFIVFSLSVIFSQSLGVCLILFFLVIFYYKFYVTIFLILSFYFLNFFTNIFFTIDLIEYRFSGGFNYTSSLEERFYLIKNNLREFLNNPAGIGPLDTVNNIWTHSENTFVDIMKNFGIYGIFLIIVLLINLIKNFKFSIDPDIKFVNMLLFVIFIFIFFHSSSNFYIIYFLLVLITSMYKVKKALKVI